MMPVYASVRSQAASFHWGMKKEEKNHFDNEWKWKNDLAAGAQLVCLEFSLSISFPPFSIFTLTLSHFIPLCHHMSVACLFLE